MGTLATHTPAMMIRDYIVANGRNALFTGWTFKFGTLPPEPDQCIVLIDQPGEGAFPHLLVDFLGLQVLVRGIVAGDGYKTGYLMARQVRDIILGMPNHPPEFEELDGLTERSPMTPLGNDDKNRHIWSMNFRMIVEPKTNALTHRESL